MTTISTSIFAALTFEPLTIKEIAEAIEKSESRTRELVKAAVADGSLEAHDTRPATFSLYHTANEEDEMDDASPEAPDTEEDWMDESELPLEANPFAALVMPQAEGQAETEAPVLLQDMIEALPKAKKAPLNPQPMIDKKVAIMEKAGGSITYAARTWTITDAEGNSVTISSKEFSLYKGEEILDVFHEVEGQAA